MIETKKPVSPSAGAAVCGGGALPPGAGLLASLTSGVHIALGCVVFPEESQVEKDKPVTLWAADVCGDSAPAAGETLASLGVNRKRWDRLAQLSEPWRLDGVSLCRVSLCRVGNFGRLRTSLVLCRITVRTGTLKYSTLENLTFRG